MRFFEHQQKARAQTVRLLILFTITVAVLVVVINIVLALLMGLLWRSEGYTSGMFMTSTAITLLFVGGGWWIESTPLDSGGQKLAKRAGAREARPSSSAAEQQLCNIISEMAIASGMKAPQAMVLPRDESINAFACGWTQDDAVVAVTEGALDRLTREEMQGLVAHEFSHLREGDTRLNMHLSGMVLGLEMMFNVGESMSERDERGRLSPMAITGYPLMAVGYLAWLAGRALQSAVSRQREFLADARAVQFTRSKDGLGGVLRKIAGLQRNGYQPRSKVHPGVAHMMLADSNLSAKWFLSHPPLSERVRRIYGRSMPVINSADSSGRTPAVF